MDEAKQRAVHGGYVGDGAPAAFVRAWLAAAAEPDAYLDLGRGMVGDMPVVVLTLGAFTAALTVEQTRSTAEAFVESMRGTGLDTLVDRVSDLVVVLRQAADMVEASTLEPLPEPRMLPGLGA